MVPSHRGVQNLYHHSRKKVALRTNSMFHESKANPATNSSDRKNKISSEVAALSLLCEAMMSTIGASRYRGERAANIYIAEQLLCPHVRPPKNAR